MSDSLPKDDSNFVETPIPAVDEKARVAKQNVSTSSIESSEDIQKSAIEKFVRALGFNSESDVKKLVKKVKEQEDAHKSELEKLQDKARAFEDVKAQLEDRTLVLAQYASDAMEALTPSQKKAVLSIAGDNPAAQLKTLESLRKGGFFNAEKTPMNVDSNPSEKDKKTLMEPASTSNAMQAPVASTPQSPNYMRDFKEKSAKNPFRGADYLARHAAQIFAQNHT